MQAIAEGLVGLQLTLLPEVEAYWLENPRLAPDRSLKPRFHTPEQNARSLAPAADAHTPEHKSHQRRHSPRGQASGWIEQRLGNKQRKKPSVSYYYGWYVEQDGKWQKMKCYVPAGKVDLCRQMVEAGQPVGEILQFLNPSTIG